MINFKRYTDENLRNLEREISTINNAIDYAVEEGNTKREYELMKRKATLLRRIEFLSKSR